MGTPTAHDDRWIVMIHGELDITTQDHLVEVAAILGPLGMPVDLDLSGVSFIDASGWDGVTAAIQQLRGKGVPARVVRPSESVRKLERLMPGPALLPAA